MQRLRAATGSPAIATIRLLPRAGLRHTFGLVGLSTLGGLLPIVALIANSFLIASVPEAVKQGFGSSAADRLWVALVAAFAAFILQQSVAPIRQAVGDSLGSGLDLLLRQKVMKATAVPTGIAHLEDPQTVDKIALTQNLGEAWGTPGTTVPMMASLLSSRLQGMIGTLILFGFRWWAPLVLLPGWLLANQWFSKEVKALLESRHAKTATFRRSGYFRDLSLLPTAAKEIRVFGISSWIVDRFGHHWSEGIQETWRELRGRRGEMIRSVMLLVGGNALVLGTLARAGARGELGIGLIALYAQAILTMSRLGYLGTEQFWIQQGTASVPHVLELEEISNRPHIRLVGTRVAEGLPRSAISFEGVRFRYPGRDDYVFEGLDLSIPAGGSLAIVGENGAGKTTIIKLLARLYDPESGRITVDGIDLREFDPAHWRKRLAVIFQDFVQYQLAAADNVGIGSLSHAADLAALERAASKAGASEVIASLPNKWETVLSRQYEGGADLSGGEWQRVALARAFFAVEGGAGILVLDEPTASLDVRAEAQIYERFLDLTRGLTTVLISHRFSSVRRADRICVLEAGRVTEEGTHEELIDLGGKYAEMFRLQASRFREDEVSEELS